MFLPERGYRLVSVCNPHGGKCTVQVYTLTYDTILHYMPGDEEVLGLDITMENPPHVAIGQPS